MELEDRYVKVRDINTHFVAAGRGSPLILLHGLGGSIISWQQNILPLAQEYRIYALDLAGHGYSEKPPIDYTLSFAVDFLLNFISTQGIDRASLVGNSTGGLIALAVALRIPEKVERLVLVDSTGLGRELSLFLRLLTVPVLGEIMAWPTKSRVRILLRQMFYDSRFVTEELVEKLYSVRKSPGAKRALLNAMRHGANLTGLYPTVVLRDRLHQLRTPTLIVWGARDRLIPVSHAYVAHSLIPGSKLHVFQNCGHCPPMERAEEFNRLVLDFLREEQSQAA